MQESVQLYKFKEAPKLPRLTPEPPGVPAGTNPQHDLQPPNSCPATPLCACRSTARQQWRLIVLNLGRGLVEAFTEGATLAVVFLAVVFLAAPAGTPFNWASPPALAKAVGTRRAMCPGGQWR